MFFRILAPFALALGVVYTQGAGENTLLQDLFEAKSWRRGNWEAVTERFGLVKYQWTTNLPTNTVVNETAYLAGTKNVLLMKSRDRDLKTEGYDKSTTMIDFDGGMMAFRTKFPTTNDLPGPTLSPEAAEGMTRRERRRRLRNFFAGRDQACFITTTSSTLADVKTELQSRVNSSPVSTGTPVKFVAEEINRLSAADLSRLNAKIAKFCTKAAKHNNHFRLVQDSTATTHPDSLVVMGQFDTAQPLKSIPYEIHVEQSVINAVRTPLSTTVPPEA